MYQLEFLDIEENMKLEETIKKVVNKCFEVEGLTKTKLYLSITLTNSENIRKINKKYRNIDSETDVLSFPMFEKSELETMIKQGNMKHEDVLGDIVISVPKVEEQSKEYNHSFERELSYMIVHGFYHIMGYDHIEEDERHIMREKEETVLQSLGITRDEE